MKHRGKFKAVEQLYFEHLKTLPDVSRSVSKKYKHMKAVFIVFNQSNTERVEYMLEQLAIRGFTFFEQVQGQGTKSGEPRRGTHTWPEMNSAIISVVEEDKVDIILKTVRKLDQRNKEIGVRAFVWNIEQTV